MSASETATNDRSPAIAGSSGTSAQFIRLKNGLVLAAMVAWGAGLALSLSFWPGIMIWDSSRQYRQALSGAFDDWHPPLMEAIWRLLIPLMPGPGPMLILQLALFGLGLGALVWRSARQERPWEAVGLALTALLPFTLLLMATIVKDALMAAVLLAVFALFTRAFDRGGKLSRVIGIVLVIIACCLRYNAFLAGLPLILMAMPASWTAHRGRSALIAAATVLLLLLAMPIANRLLGAERSGAELSLVIYDLAGITAQSGNDVFPPLPVPNIVQVNQGCYDPEKWDAYAWWVDDPCPIQFTMVRSAFASRHIQPELFWIGAIATHPIAYAEHRLAHWNVDSQFLVRKTPERWLVSANDPNEWGFRVAPNIVNRLVIAAAWVVHATPMGWPCWWLALCFGVAVLGRGLSRSRPMLALVDSALLYGLGYAVFGVASELRYYCWTMIAALIASVMFLTCWRETPVMLRPDRVRQAIAATPLILVTLMGLGWRWFG